MKLNLPNTELSEHDEIVPFLMGPHIVTRIVDRHFHILIDTYPDIFVYSKSYRENPEDIYNLSDTPTDSEGSRRLGKLRY